jgi:hypothetical protein
MNRRSVAAGNYPVCPFQLGEQSNESSRNLENDLTPKPLCLLEIPGKLKKVSSTLFRAHEKRLLMERLPVPSWLSLIRSRR